jgi:hypothetical protein
MKKLLSTLAIALTLITSAAYADDKPSPLTAQQATQFLQEGKPIYSCSMKTDWFSDKPGQCPCCTMDLEKVKEIKDGKAVFEESKDSMNMKGMDMKDMPMKDNMMEKK